MGIRVEKLARNKHKYLVSIYPIIIGEECF